VWAVRLRPVGGRAARVGYSDLKRQYRNLSGDVEAGRTVWAAMRQSKELPSREGVELGYIRVWALSDHDKKPVTLDCRTAPRRSLKAVLDVSAGERSERPAAVDFAARAFADAG
jgi:hypothetical protein